MVAPTHTLLQFLSTQTPTLTLFFYVCISSPYLSDKWRRLGYTDPLFLPGILYRMVKMVLYNITTIILLTGKIMSLLQIPW